MTETPALPETARPAATATTFSLDFAATVMFPPLVVVTCALGAIDASVSFVTRGRDGLIARMEMFFSRGQALEAVGLEA